MDIISIQNVSYAYPGNIRALSSISLSIERGDFLSILGPNGSGKTTLLGVMSGVLNPFEGKVLLEGIPISRMSKKEIARKIAYVPQTIQVDFPFTVRQIVMMGRFAYLRGLGIEGKKDIEIADRAMEMTGILPLADRMIHQLSGGERQRAFIAQAIAAEPSILMLDEPISNLDIKYQAQIMDLLADLNLEKGITVIATQHDLNLAGIYSKKILLMRDGKVVSLGVPGDVLSPENIRNVFDVEVAFVKDVEKGNAFIVPITKNICKF